MLVRRKLFPFYFILACATFVATTSGQRRRKSPSLPTFFNNDDDFINENVHFFGPPTDEFWQQFWDVFNYRGPHQENSFSRPLSRPYASSVDRPALRPVIRPAERPDFSPIVTPVDRPRNRPYLPEYGYEEGYSEPGYYVPSRETVRPVRQEITTVDEDEYNRYRDYFYRRYGNNFLD